VRIRRRAGGHSPWKHTTMKNKALFLMLISATVIATGCDKKRTASEQLDRVQTKTAQDLR
jgi:hypothetical protein